MRTWICFGFLQALFVEWIIYQGNSVLKRYDINEGSANFGVRLLF